MIKKNVIIAIMILLIIIPLFSDVSKFKIHEQSLDTITSEEETEVDYDSQDYEIGYEDGIEYYKELAKNRSCLTNYLNNLFRRTGKLPDYALKRNLNYRTGFEDGYRDTNKFSMKERLLLTSIYLITSLLIPIIIRLLI